MARARQFAGYLPAVAYAAVLLYFGTRAGGPEILSRGHLDKVAHFSAYAGLGALLAWGWLKAGRRPAAGVLVAAALAQGMAEELLQTRIPGRYGDPLDWLADAAGAITGFMVAARAIAQAGNRVE